MKKIASIIEVEEKAAGRSRAGFLKERWWLAGIIGLVALGVFGSGLKYLEDDAKRQKAERAASASQTQNQQGGSLLNRVNPFVEPPPPSPTPQLSKEYIYAGSRMLAVEDAGAQAAPPADLAVWRPLTGVWWVLGGPGSQQTSAQWGASTDTPVPGDYDGDGKTDFSVFRPATQTSSATWWIAKSSTQETTFIGVTWGIEGDIPAPADFDGDGKTDIAVYRAGTWYTQQSSDGTIIYPQFGLAGDKPDPKDFDGDGRADLAVWRGSNTSFYSNNSSNGQTQSATFTQTTDKDPVSGDYDGDGRADYAIRNGSNWIIRKSTNNSTDTISWEQSGDESVQNDYDGDGKVDIAVWRPVNGTWYIRQSGLSNSLRQVQWGANGDIPVPAYYRR